MTTRETQASCSKLVFKKSTLAVCIAALTAAQAYGQTAATEDPAALEEVVVYGIKQSLQNAQDIKRGANTVVDAISASDIGSLPDASVLEALQRVPGITIERFAAPDDPDHFSVEGSGATLRGLPQTRSEFNGRDTFSANSRRGLSFQDVSPELMGSVEVFKAQTADMIEGGISGTVNLNTRKPLDTDGITGGVTVKTIYNDLIKEATPAVSGLFSTSWDSEFGEFGVLASWASTEMKTRSDGVEIGKYAPVTRMVGDQSVTALAPYSGGLRQKDNYRSRVGKSLVFQWESPNDFAEVTLEYMGSSADEKWLERAFYSDDAGGTPSTNSVYAPSATYAGGIFQSGLIRNFSNMSVQTRGVDKTTAVDDYSFNLKLNPSERLTLELDLQFVEAETSNTDLSTFGAINVDMYLDTNRNNPLVVFKAPTGSGVSSQEYFSDPGNYFHRAKMDHREESDGEEKAAAFDVDYELDMGFFKSVETGIRYAERDQTTRWANYNWGEIAEEWTGGRMDYTGYRTPASWADPNTPYTTAEVPPHERFAFENFARGTPSGIEGGSILAPSSFIVSSYATYLATSGAVTGSAADLAERSGVIAGTPFLPGEINPVTEKNSAFYLKLNFGNEDDSITGNIGARYVSLTRVSSGGITYTLPSPIEGDTTDDNVPQWVYDLLGQEGVLGEVKSDYDTVLPSLNVKYDVTEEFVLRFAASKSIAYPDLGDVRFFVPIQGEYENVAPANGNRGSRNFEYLKASAGNPFLEPMESVNLDLTFEYYFSDVGGVTVGLFHKDIKNFFANATVGDQIPGPDGQLRDIQVSGPINQGDGTITGVEFAYQQFFDFLPEPWDGFGLQFNFTFLDENGVPNQNTRPVQPDTEGRTEIPFEGLPLAGLSEKSYNLIAMYEKNAIKARLAYNWRDEYLLTLRQVNLGVPVYSNAGGQLDGSFSYEFTDNLELGLQASNLLNEVTKTSLQIDQEGTRVGRSWFEQDRRFELFLKAKF